MIIRCEKCQTRYRLPDEKIKPSGVKVRCPSCRHVFSVKPQESAAPAPPPEKPPFAPPGAEAESEPSTAETAPVPESSPGGDLPVVGGSPKDQVAAEQEPAAADEEGGAFGFDQEPSAEDFTAQEEPDTQEKAGFEFSFDDEPLAEQPSEEEGPAAADEEGGAFGFDQEPSAEDFTAQEEPEAQKEEGFEFSFDDEPLAEQPSAEEGPAAADEEGRAFGFDQEPSAEEFAAQEGTEGQEEAGFEFSFEDEPLPEQGAAEEGSAASGEEGFEFSFDEEPGGEAEEFSLDQAEPDAGDGPRGEGFDFDFEEEEWPEQEGDATEPASGAFEGDFGELEFSGADDEDEAAEGEQAGGPVEFAFEEEAWGESETESPASSAAEDEVGPTEFSFGEQDEPSGVSAKSAAVDEGEEFSFEEEPPQFAEPATSGGLPGEAAVQGEATPLTRPQPAPERAKKRRSPLSTVVLLVVLLLLGLSGAAAYLYFQEGISGITGMVERLTGVEPAPQVQGSIDVAGLSYQTVTSRKEGELFVIRGYAVNRFNEARSVIQVKGVLYGKQGQTLRQQSAYCGNQLSDQEIQTMPFSKIEEAMSNQFGEALANLSVAPGKKIPFTLVFRNIPTELNEYAVEVVDSKPATK